MSKLETNIIDTLSGTSNLTIGSTNSSTVTFENGAVTGHMYPAFSVNLGTDQTINSSTITKVEYDTEDYDTDSDFDTTNNHFKVSVAGKYQFNTVLSFDNGTGSDPDRGVIYVYKNDSNAGIINDISRPASGRFMSMNASFTLDLAVDDEVEIRAYVSPGTTTRLLGGQVQRNRFSGFRLGA
jgi:hypothetical protein